MNTLALGDAALPADVRARLVARSTPAIFSATYDSIVVERSGGPSHQFDHVPSSRRRARRSFASLRSVGRVAQPEHVEPEEMLGDHRRVRLQLADPPAVPVLQLEQRAASPPRWPVECRQLCCDAQAATFAVRDVSAHGPLRRR